MRYLKSKDKYKASNVELDIGRMMATSYGWWVFVRRAPCGRVLFDAYGYSSSTIRHQWKVRRVLDELGISYVSIHAPAGLQGDGYGLLSAVSFYEQEITSLTAAMARKGTRAGTNAARAEAVIELQGKLDLIWSIAAAAAGKELDHG